MESIEISGHIIKRVSLNSPVPNGWRLLARGEASKWKHHINKMLGHWSIVALDCGKIDGPGYGNKIMDSYGSECGQKFIITP